MPTPSTAEKERTPLDSALAAAKLGKPSSDMLCTTSMLYPPHGGRGYFFQIKIQPERQANLVGCVRKHITLNIMLGQTGTQCHPVIFASPRPTCHTKAKMVLMQHNTHPWISQAQNTALLHYVFTGSVHLPSRPCEQPGSSLPSCN